MNKITYLKHEELVSLFKQGKINVRVNMGAAMHICDTDPRIPIYRKAPHHFWKWVGLLMMIGGPISFFYISWFWSLIIFIGSFLVMDATRQCSGQFVCETVIENESLYYELLQAGILSITEK